MRWLPVVAGAFPNNRPPVLGCAFFVVTDVVAGDVKLANNDDGFVPAPKWFKKHSLIKWKCVIN